ncbi:MAG: TonB-dependent receptor [Candidatus Omnitrophica bacterium]|nr:TonB-dependent receptor [Candidatus Omnitrophota bacterium]
MVLVINKPLLMTIARHLWVACFIVWLTLSRAAGAAAQEQEIDLEKIVVTSYRVPVGLSQVSDNAQVTYADEIEELPAEDLGQALSYLPGIYVEPVSEFGRATSVSIQGANSRQVRIMIDGIPLNTQASGQVNPSKFPIEIAERIETIEGAASSTWGSSLGGVINVITKDTGDTFIPKGNLTGSYAGYRTQKESFDLSGKAGSLGYYVFSSIMDSGGKGPRDDVLEKKMFGKVSYDLDEFGKINSSFGFSQGDVNSGEFPDGTWEADPYRCQYGKLGWSKSFDNIDLALDFKNSRQDITRKDFDNTGTDIPWRTINSRDVLYEISVLSAMRPRGKDLLVVGADFDLDILKSTYLTESRALNLQAPFVNYSLRLDPWDWNLGLRYDHNSEFGQDLSPSFGCVYHFNRIPETLMRLNVSRAFNAPPLLWKYYNQDLSGLTVNPDLKPERAWVYELAAESRPIPRLWLKVSLYRADVFDAISNAKDAQGDWIKQNFQKFRRQGVEARAKFKVLEGFNFFTAAAFNDVEDRIAKQTVKDTDSPRQSFNLGFEYKHEIGFNLYINGRYNYWNKTFDDFQSKDRKFVFDLKAQQKIKHLTCFLNIYNLFDSNYCSDYFFPLPKRYFEGGVSINW